jgi:hypothetical protein
MIIKLTEAQADWVRWALDGPISEYRSVKDVAHAKACSGRAALTFMVERGATRLDGRDLTIPDDLDTEGEFFADLMDMLEHVGPDITPDGAYEDALREGRTERDARLMAQSKLRSCTSAAAKIRKALGVKNET